MTTATDRIFVYLLCFPTEIPKNAKRIIVFHDGANWCVWPYTTAAKANKAMRGIMATGETRFELHTRAEWALEHHDDVIKLYGNDL